MAGKFKNSVWEVIKFALITLIIVVPIRTYVAQPFVVSGASMDPTFEHGQYLIIDELSYYLRQPTRGEVVVFRYPKDPSKHFIKRIIGLPGETVIVKNNEVDIKKGNETMRLNEPYVHNSFSGNVELVLGPNDYFVMGDNRSVSLDSRAWGALPEKLITGRVLVRLFPFGQVGVLPGVYTP
ncbi:MAG: signal peptidase I [Candidatus Vogelbacteria bacterium]|nr:signal peptidase I [Candidatus Vogelbacteria bacterium]